MPTYVCLIHDRADKVLAVQSISASDDHDAVEVAEAMTAAYRNVRGYELWRKGQRIACNLPSSGLVAGLMTAWSAIRSSTIQ